MRDTIDGINEKAWEKAMQSPIQSPPRYILTRMKSDPAVAKRYRLHGWMAFDTQYRAHGQVWLSRQAALEDVVRLNRG